MTSQGEEAPSGRNSPWAVAAFVVGLAGVGAAASPFWFPIVPSIAAIVIAGKATRDIRRSRGALRGLGFARAGRVLGWLGIVVRILVVVLIELEQPWLLAIAAPAVIIVPIVFRGARRAEQQR